jgi:hypothetical protein
MPKGNVMTKLETLAEKTEAVFDVEDGLKLPDFSTQTKDYIDAYRELGLTNHESDLHYFAKCEIAKKAGLQEVSEEEIVRMLTNDEVKIKRTIDSDFAEIEEFFDPLFNETYKATFRKRVFSSPFMAKIKFEPIHMVPLSGLKCAIPYGVLLRVLELRKLNFFNCFLAFAPETVIREGTYARAARVDPVIVASLAKGHTRESDWRRNSADRINTQNIEFAHFFVAKW